MPTFFVGHPLIQTLAPFTSTPIERDPNLVILLPGSRHSEFSRLMSVFMETASVLHRQNPLLKFHIPLRNEQNIRAVKEIMTTVDPSFDSKLFEFSSGDAREWMRRGSAGIAASGTVTVEATILGLPLVVTYKLHPLTYFLARRFVKLPYVSITNLVTEKCVFEELLQEKATAENLSRAVLDILPEGCRRSEVLSGMEDCVRQLGEGQDVARNVADNVLDVALKAKTAN